LRAAAKRDATVALADLGAHRLLCAHRDGPRGVRHWNRRVEQWLAEAGDVDVRDPAYVGRPVLITTNDHALGVYNGDAGVVVNTGSGPRVALPAAARSGTAGALRTFATSRLPELETMHAMTIHKSQGSQATEVTVLLPEVDSRLLTRELLYTAVTRAQKRVRVVGTESELRAAFERRVHRASGLGDRIRNAPVTPAR
jgi:exodeoxyribonuclease V alpha subunit